MANRKRKKKPPEKGPAFAGFSGLFARAAKRYAVALPVTAALTVAGAVLVRFADGAFFRAVLIAALIALLSAAAVPAAREAMLDSHSPDALSPVPEHERKFVRAGTVTASVVLPLLAAAAVASSVVFGALWLITSVKLAAAGAVAFLSAALYLSMTTSTVSASHTVDGRRERRGFILGFVGLHAIGAAVLVFVLAASSSIPLGEDFSGEGIPEGTVLGISLIYLFASALRSAYLFFVMRHRFSSRMKLGARYSHK